MDIELEGEMHGLQAGVAIKQQRPETNIVVLSAHKDTQFLSTIPMGEAEGWSYLMKQSVSGAGTLMRVIEGSASGLTVLDSEIVRDLTPRGDSSLARLTRRQLDVLELMAQGYNNAAIAERLSIGLTSVENYINSLYRELNLTEEPGIHARVRATLLYAEEARAVG